VPIRRHPRVVLEEVDARGIVVMISVAPRNPADGGRLASELLDAVTREIEQPSPPQAQPAPADAGGS
jgi:hypothetical protein